MKKYDKVYSNLKAEVQALFQTPNIKGILTEKIDRSNMQFQKVLMDEGQLVQLQFGTRNTPFPLDTKKGDYGAFNDSVDFISEKVDMMKLNPAYIYFGEGGKNHRINYTNLPPFVLFDIFDTEKNRYLDWEELKIIANDLDLPLVKAHFNGPINGVLKYLNEIDINNLPSFYGDVMAEGVVLRADPGITDRFGNHQRAKFVSDKFKETKSTKIPQTLEGFIDGTLTTARIQKKCDFFTDEKGLELEPKLIGGISQMVLKDLFEEELKRFLKLGIVDLNALQRGVKMKVIEHFREELKLI